VYACEPRFASAAELYGSYDGVGLFMASDSGGVEAYHYRSSVENLQNYAVALDATGGSSDATTQATFNRSLVEEVAAAAGLNSSSNLDVFVATVQKNIFAFALAGTQGSAQAAGSRADQPSTLNGPTLLRSAVTWVEVSLEDSVAPLAIDGLTSTPVQVRLLATVRKRESPSARTPQVRASPHWSTPRRRQRSHT